MNPRAVLHQEPPQLVVNLACVPPEGTVLVIGTRHWRIWPDGRVDELSDQGLPDQ